MSDIKLFRINGSQAVQLEGQSVALEKSLQTLIETHLDVFLGIRFLCTEYSTGKTQPGRIDSLGIDENGCPCIVEYKRSSNENVINQGLYYLDWLLDHKGEFQLLVLNQFGKEVADNIEWSSPRLLCIAGDFNKYDAHAVQQINRNIELLRYKKFGNDLLMLELVNAVQATAEHVISISPKKPPKDYDAELAYQLAQTSESLRDLYESFKDTCLAFGDDVQVKTLKKYVAFKRIKNFATVEIKHGLNTLQVCIKVDPDSIVLEEGFTRDVREVGHWGTGDLAITLKNQADLIKAMPLLQKSYEIS